MEMAWVWTGMVTLSLAFGLLTGNLDAVANAALEGARSAVELSLAMAGVLCLWSGVMEIMNACGLSAGLARLFRRLLRRLLWMLLQLWLQQQLRVQQQLRLHLLLTCRNIRARAPGKQASAVRIRTAEAFCLSIEKSSEDAGMIRRGGAYHLDENIVGEAGGWPIRRWSCWRGRFSARQGAKGKRA